MMWIGLRNEHEECLVVLSWLPPRHSYVVAPTADGSKGLTLPYIPLITLRASKCICLCLMFWGPGINSTTVSSVDSITPTSVPRRSASIILNINTKLGVANLCGRMCLQGSVLLPSSWSMSLKNSECSSYPWWHIQTPQSHPSSSGSIVSLIKTSYLLSARQVFDSAGMLRSNATPGRYFQRPLSFQYSFRLAACYFIFKLINQHGAYLLWAVAEVNHVDLYFVQSQPCILTPKSCRHIVETTKLREMSQGNLFCSGTASSWSQNTSWRCSISLPEVMNNLWYFACPHQVFKFDPCLQLKIFPNFDIRFLFWLSANWIRSYFPRS